MQGLGKPMALDVAVCVCGRKTTLRGCRSCQLLKGPDDVMLCPCAVRVAAWSCLKEHEDIDEDPFLPWRFLASLESDAVRRAFSEKR